MKKSMKSERKEGKRKDSAIEKRSEAKEKRERGRERER